MHLKIPFQKLLGGLLVAGALLSSVLASHSSVALFLGSYDYDPAKDYSFLSKIEQNTYFSYWAEKLKTKYNISFIFLEENSSELGTLTSVLGDNDVNDGFWCAYRIWTLPESLRLFIKQTGGFEVHLSKDKEADEIEACPEGALACAVNVDQGYIRIHYGFGNKSSVNHEMGHIVAYAIQDQPDVAAQSGLNWSEIEKIFLTFSSSDLSMVEEGLCPDPLPVEALSCYELTQSGHHFVVPFQYYSDPGLAISFKEKALNLITEENNSILWNKYVYLRDKIFFGKEYTDLPDQGIKLISKGWEVTDNAFSKLILPGTPFHLNFELKFVGFPGSQTFQPHLEIEKGQGISYNPSFPKPLPFKASKVGSSVLTLQCFLASDVVSPPAAGQVVTFKLSVLDDSTGQKLGGPFVLKVPLNSTHFLNIFTKTALYKLSVALESIEEIAFNSFEYFLNLLNLEASPERLIYDPFNNVYWVLSDPSESQPGVYRVGMVSKTLGGGKILKPWWDKTTFYDKPTYQGGRRITITGFLGHLEFRKLWLSHFPEGTTLETRFWVSTNTQEIFLFDVEGQIIKKWPLSAIPESPDPVGFYKKLNHSFYVAQGNSVWSIHETKGQKLLFTTAENIVAIADPDLLELPGYDDYLLVGTESGEVLLYYGKKGIYSVIDSFKVQGSIQSLGSIGEDGGLYVSFRDGIRYKVLHYDDHTKVINIIYETDSDYPIKFVKEEGEGVVIVVHFNEKYDQVLKLSKNGNIPKSVILPKVYSLDCVPLENLI